jgi:tetratricopeptide (TPR) repeat protein
VSDAAAVRAQEPAASKAPNADLRAWAVAILAGAWLGYFLFTGMPQVTLHVFPRTLVFHALVGAAAIVYVGYLAWSRRLPGGTPLDVAALAIAAAYAVGTLASLNWRLSLDASLQASAGLIAFYVLSGLPMLSARHLWRVFALTGAALSLYALWVVGNDYADYLSFARHIEGLGTDNIFPPTVPRVHDVSDHPNVLAMLLTLFMPFFAMAAYRSDKRWERFGGLAGLAVGGMAIFLTLSRGGWFGVAVGVGFTIAASWLTVRWWEREQRDEPVSWQVFVPAGVSPTALAAVGGAIALAVGGTLAFLANSSTRPGWLFRSSLSPREDAWRAGWHIFRDHPLFGAGPDVFGILYPQFAHGNFLVHTRHAHNGFLQFADDAGIFGIVALLIAAGAVIFALYRTWRTGTLPQRLLAVASAGALLGFAAHNQVDAGNIWKAPAFGLAAVGAIIARNYAESTSGAPPAAMPRVPDWVVRRGPAVLRAVALLVVIVPLVGWYRSDRAHYDYWQGMEKLNKGEPGALEALQRAVNGDSSMMVYQLALGQAQADAFNRAGGSDQSLIDKAIIHLQRAVSLDHRSDLAHANLAKAYQLAGRDDDAAREAQIARLAIYHVPPVLVAGEVYEDIGRADDAIETYGQVISMDASLADSAFWQGSEFRRSHFDDILQHSSLGLNKCTEGAYLVRAHRFDSSVSLAGLAEAAEGCKFLVYATSPNDVTLRVELASIMMGQGQVDAAREHLDFAVNRQPDFGPARTELGRWYAEKGDIDQARHEWVVGGQLDEPESLLLLGRSYPAGEVPADVRHRLESMLRTVGSSVQNDLISVLYYRMSYARISPRVALIPGDWQTAVSRVYAEMQAAVQDWNMQASTRSGPGS